MNSNDVKPISIEELVKKHGGLLEAMFARQTELEEKYNVIEKANGELIPELPLDAHTFDGQRRIRSIIYRITEELYEAGNCLRNKAWKTSQVPCDVDHFLEEVSDSLHFVIQLYLELGIDAKGMADLYFKKAQVNKFRQETKY